MPKHESGTPPLPDLTGMSLRSLRAARTDRDPALAAAVDRALQHPADLGETWYSCGTEGGRARG
ncbi:hypothetical protein ACFY2W_12320 [Streptomyces sp. NPDC001262]|uniref:hypothetical protein n=1 Tax=Streptomyces TaxID=1883 RepID=UPI0036B77762